MAKKITKKATKTLKNIALNKKAPVRGRVITVKNAEGDPDTTATILIQNKINYTPKVSVIIPVYNVEEYLRECLDSVVNQTLKEIEIICVDDGSTDKSLEILKEYAKKDNRITVITQKNLHAGVARNAGLAVARGEYVHFLDSDDFFELNMFEEMYNKAKKDKSDIVVCENAVYDSLSQKVTRFVRIDDRFAEVSPFSPETFKDILFNFTNPNPWTKLFSRDLFVKYDLYFEKYTRCNDITCVCSALAVAGKISTIQKPFAIYRSNQKNNVTAKRADNIDCFLYAADKLEKNLKRLNLYNSFKDAFINRIKSSFKWECSVCSNEQLENVKKMAQKFLSTELYNVLYVPKFSVIIPVYNTEEYLSQCLESVINQSLKDIEIICINDGSSDNSLKIMQQYADADKRIIILNQKNCGLATSRNNALKIVRGEYCDFLDADDFLVPDALEKLYNYAVKHDLDMLAFSGYNFYNNSDELLENLYWNFRWLPENWNKEIFTYKDCSDFMHLMAVSSCLTVYKTSFILKNNIRFPDGLVYEDNIFWTVAFTSGARYGILREKLYRRRLHDESITSNWDKNLRDWIDINDMLLQYLNSIKFDARIIDVYAKTRLKNIEDKYNNLNPIDKKRLARKLKCFLKKYKPQQFDIRKRYGVKSCLLFPYYLCANIVLKNVCIPWFKIQKHVKSLIYSHSARGRMDRILQQIQLSKNETIKQISNIMTTMQSVQNNIQKQIDNVKSQQNELVKQLNNNANNTKSQIDSVVLEQKSKFDMLADNIETVKHQFDNSFAENQNQTNNLTQQIDMLKNDFDKIKSELMSNIDSLSNTMQSNTDALRKDYTDFSGKINDTLNQNAKAIDVKYHELSENIQKNMSEQKSVFEKDIDSLSKQLNDITDSTASNNEHVDNVLNNIEKRVLTFEQNNKNLFVKNSEPYWANVYHDTINNSHWLTNKSVSPGRWAVSYIVLYVLYRILDEIEPQTILECGLGQSSKLTIQYTESHNADLTICENNPEWLSFFMRQFPTADKYAKILDTEMVHIVPEYESRTYKDFKSVIKNKKFNLVLIDGPLGSEHYSRPEILDIVDNLDKSFVIMLDDMNRIGEQETWKMLKAKLTEKGIAYKDTIYSSDKSVGLLCSPDLVYLTSL